MSDNKEAGRIILADLKMFNEAVILFEQEIDPAFWLEFNKAIECWAKDRRWNIGGDMELENKYSWLAPEVYEEKLRFDFKSDVKQENGWLSYSLANLCGVGTAIGGLLFSYEVEGKGWKRAARSIRDDYTDRLKPLGFSTSNSDENPFYLPLQLDASGLVDAWINDDFDELLCPLVTALGNLEKAVPILNEFVEEVRALSQV